jgi:hypothetical protein
LGILLIKWGCCGGLDFGWIGFVLLIYCVKVDKKSIYVIFYLIYNINVNKIMKMKIGYFWMMLILGLSSLMVVSAKYLVPVLDE